MSIPAEEIFQIESRVEGAIAIILSTVPGAKIYDTTTRLDNAVTPRIEVKCIVGAALEHRHNFSDYAIIPNARDNRQQAFDAWDCRVELAIVCNRTSDPQQLDHRRLLGMVRHRLTLAYVWKNWKDPVILPNDVREQGTVDSLVNEDGVDISVVAYDLVVNVNTKDTWPNTIGD